MNRATAAIFKRGAERVERRRKGDAARRDYLARKLVRADELEIENARLRKEIETLRAAAGGPSAHGATAFAAVRGNEKETAGEWHPGRFESAPGGTRPNPRTERIPQMKMTLKVVFDPTEIAPKDLKAAIAAVDAGLVCDFLNHRETKPDSKAPKDGART